MQVADSNLKRKDDHSEADDSCDAQCNDHDVSFMEAGNHSHHIRNTQGQDGLKIRENTCYNLEPKACFES